jgi:hypothetical protein
VERGAEDIVAVDDLLQRLPQPPAIQLAIEAQDALGIQARPAAVRRVSSGQPEAPLLIGEAESLPAGS